MKKLKEFNNNLKIKMQEWATTKTTLYAAMLAVVSFTIISILFSLLCLVVTGMPGALDSTLTSEWFGFWTMVVGTGGTISVFKLFNIKKPKTPHIKIEVGEEKPASSGRKKKEKEENINGDLNGSKG